MSYDDFKAIAANSLRNQENSEKLLDACDNIAASLGPLTAIIKDADLDEEPLEKLMWLMFELRDVQAEIRQYSAATAETAAAVYDLSKMISGDNDQHLR